MKEISPDLAAKREYMERARKIWEELGLPKLKPESPWFGYSLGEWPDELERAAELAMKGDYSRPKAPGQAPSQDVKMNTEVRDLQEPKKISLIGDIEPGRSSGCCYGRSISQNKKSGRLLIGPRITGVALVIAIAEVEKVLLWLSNKAL